MDEDVDVSRWILEFLLRKSENNGVVKRALKAIPFPNDDLRLKKTVLLGAIESELSDASVSETFLENLEIVEELDHRQGFETLHSMKDAYCAVALECTVKYLVVRAASRRGRKYLEAVKRIWRGRISQMEESGKTHLLTDELKKRREEVEAAIFDASLSKKFAAMNTRNDALRLVGVYLGEAWALMGPAFLELAERLRDKQNVVVGSDVDEVGDAVDGSGAVENQNDRDGHEMDAQPTDRAQVQELNVQSTNKVDANGSRNDQLCDKAAEEIVTSTNAGRELLVTDRQVPKDKEIQKENLALGCKPGTSHRCHRGPVKIVDIDNLGPDTSCCKSDSLSTCNVNEVQQTLKSNCSELQAKVTDPLPEIIRVSETVTSDLATKELNRMEVDIPNPFDKSVVPIAIADKSAEPSQSFANVDKSAEPTQPSYPIQSCNGNVGNPSCSHHQNNGARPSIMERNNTAQTYEWVDSADGSPEGKVNHTGRLHLPGPKRKAVTPLPNNEMAKLAKRRKVKRWSMLEEDTLRTGILKYGEGNWKLILDSYREIFQGRKQVDLKDKWRNMKRYKLHF
ncbi:hypothetical protein FNV43_RR23797 [Rhamnella rubrinervis]|uniref:Uncharacterized protein n=1 Tax=Rhamnella rubrinervis TaxID=2594499 RepID=A0A8K0DKJ4_9ROSA|nr:hypothetical protein FNV43_RR23797 [Rhamnella rubrinervis]